MGSSRRRTVFWPLAVAGIAVAAAGIYFLNRDTPEKNKPTKSKAIPTSSKISIVVSKSLLDSGPPLGLLLEKYPAMTIILCPDVDEEVKKTHVDSQINPIHYYKVIPCETGVGITHIIKHLRADLVVLSEDSGVEVEDIANFVGSITKLDTSHVEKCNAQFKELFF